MEITRRHALAVMGGLVVMALNPVTDQFSQFLRLAFFRSPNFVAGSAGWTINQDGSAEFNNVTVRGTVIAGHFVGTGEGQEFLIYAGAPVLGNLLASIVSVAGTDSSGNAFLAGTTVYTTGLLPIAVNISGGQLSWQTAATQAGPYTTQADLQISAANDLQIQNAAAATTLALAAAGGAQLNTFLALINTAIPAGAAGQAQLFAAADQAGMVNASGQALRLSGAVRASVGTATVTQATLTSLFSDTINGGDAKVGAVYEIEAYGFGQWGSTQQALTFAIRFGATAATVIGVTPTIANVAFSASANFRWEVKIILTCVTTGVGATWVATIKGCVTQTGTINPGTAASNSVPFVGGTGSGTVTLDSTIAEILGLSANWASTTGAPTLTRVAGHLRRVA